jgi:hypothetical protein
MTSGERDRPFPNDIGEVKELHRIESTFCDSSQVLIRVLFRQYRLNHSTPDKTGVPLTFENTVHPDIDFVKSLMKGGSN